MYMYRTFHTTSAQYTFFASAHETFSRIDLVLSHKTSLSKCKKTEIISRIFSNSKGIKVEVNNRKKTGKFTNV